jgi:hypothetical protein
VSRDLPKLGDEGVESCALSVVDGAVPAEALLGGQEGQGFTQMMRGLEIGRIQVAVTTGSHHLPQIHRFGPGGPSSLATLARTQAHSCSLCAFRAGVDATPLQTGGTTVTTPAQAGQGYFVQLMGTESGPHSHAELQQMVRDQRVKADTPVRNPQAGSWFPASQLQGLFSSKSYMTALLLSFFLGGFGVDRFYLGYTGLGVAKLLTLGGCGIWSLIDFIFIALRKLPDSDGLPLGN